MEQAFPHRENPERVQQFKRQFLVQPRWGWEQRQSFNHRFHLWLLLLYYFVVSSILIQLFLMRHRFHNTPSPRARLMSCVHRHFLISRSLYLLFTFYYLLFTKKSINATSPHTYLQGLKDSATLRAALPSPPPPFSLL